MKFRNTFFLIFALIALPMSAQLLRVSPAEVGMSVAYFSQIEKLVDSAICAKTIPGAVVAVVRGDKMVYAKAFGNKQVYPDTLPMPLDAVFDLASVSKVVSTTTCVMRLVEDGKIELNDRVDKYLPKFHNYASSFKTVPIRIVDLLTHSSGLPPYVGIATLQKKYGVPDKTSLADYINTCERQFSPRTKFSYSCLNFITLQMIVEKVSGQSLRDFAHETIFSPLGMLHTDYCPSDSLKLACVPTEKQPDGTVLCGIVHDPLARIANGGISGNAGLFSSADDLAVFSAMLLNDGIYSGKRILKASTIQNMRTERLFGRALGWDVSSTYSSAKGDFGSSAVVHTGYTGTSILLDFSSKTAIIILTNRVHPEDKGSVAQLRKAIANCVAHSGF